MLTFWLFQGSFNTFVVPLTKLVAQTHPLWISIKNIALFPQSYLCLWTT